MRDLVSGETLLAMPSNAEVAAITVPMHERLTSRSSYWRARRFRVTARLALAFAAGASTFAALAVIHSTAHSAVVTAVVGLASLGGIVVTARRAGAAYAVPAAIGALLAFDWYQFPPIHPHALPDAPSVASLLVYLGVATLVGELAASAGRRAERSEVAHGELIEEQAALRRVATLVAHGVPASEVFAAVAREVGLLIGADATHMVRYEGNGIALAVAGWDATGGHIPVGTRADIRGDNVARLVLQTGSPARVDDYGDASGPVAPMLRAVGIRSSVGCPVIVDGRLWGVVMASSKDERRLPAGTEERIAGFTELVATAISNTESRAVAARLADEQAALRRVAMLVANNVDSDELFETVARECGTLLGVDRCGLLRYESDELMTSLCMWVADGSTVVTHRCFPLDGPSLSRQILSTGRPGRIEDFSAAAGSIAEAVRDYGGGCAVGSPIVLGGRVWGALIVQTTHGDTLGPDTEARVVNFCDLVATALSNLQAREEVRRLANDQAALRRLATLVARESPATEIFAVAAQELGRVLGADDMRIVRYDDAAVIVGSWGELSDELPIGMRVPLGGENVSAVVHRTGRPARVDYTDAHGPTVEMLRGLGVHMSVGCPIVVDGRLWGAMVAASLRPWAMPPNTESRMAEFTELVATAISNVHARTELADSRARIVAATDEERRRVVRDLHDGAQQRLIHTVITLKLARRALERAEEAVPLVTEALEQAENATAELRELAHGILPAVLTRGGLPAGVEALASRMPIPVDLDVSVDRLPTAVEATAYFVVAEALTNVAKHARARAAAVTVWAQDELLSVEVVDNGIGGARPDGAGLVGLADRVATVAGDLVVETPLCGGTRVVATIPLLSS
jgi:signal transduction histidine kinase